MKHTKDSLTGRLSTPQSTCTPVSTEQQQRTTLCGTTSQASDRRSFLSLTD